MVELAARGASEGVMGAIPREPGDAVGRTFEVLHNENLDRRSQ